ncbi:MAG: Wzz/FepE/Etk N-terminal domain-containing protein, partial [Terriglobales bacterium]
MTENRELTMDDYLAMLRRRLKVILLPALLAPLAGFLMSYLFSPKYTSQSLVLVQGQEVPDNLVQPVITADFTQRLATMQQQVMAANRLRPMIERLGIAKPGEEGKLIEDVRQSMAIEPVVTDISTAAA